MQASICSASSSSIRASGRPICIATITVDDRRAQVGELHHRRGNRLRHAVEPQADLGDDAERALAADEEPRQVVAGRRLARAPAGGDHAAVGGDDGQPDHVLAHRAVADRVGAGGARGRHPADRRVRARVDREEEAGALQVGVELLARHARLHAAVEVLGVHLEHAVHPRGVERHAAVDRGDVALERGADAEGDDRHAGGRAGADDVGHLLVRLREHDEVRRGEVGEALAAAVLVADRRVDDRALAVAARQLGDETGDDVGCGTGSDDEGGVHGGSRAVRSAAGRDGAAGPRARARARTRRSGRARGPPCPG